MLSSVKRGIFLLLGGFALSMLVTRIGADPLADPASEFTTQVRPLLQRYCLSCHSESKKKGDLDLERFSSLDAVRKDAKPWEGVREMLETGEMPPKKSVQPTAAERKLLVAWVKGFLDAEARSKAGDPGRVVLRRLSHAEYNNTVRDLTGVDLQPARDFPGDGAAGEGFTNAGDALVMSPTLLNRYFAAAKDIAAHAVLLPDGLRFSPAKTRREWTNEATASLQKFYPQFSRDGRLHVAPYLAATIRQRDKLTAGQFDAVAASEKLNARYLRVFWQALSDEKPSWPLDAIRARWKQARVEEVDGLVKLIAAWQEQLWKFNKVGSYMSPVWQDAATPVLVESRSFKLPLRAPAGKEELVVYLAARDLGPGARPTQVLWQRPRFEVAGQVPILLRDAVQFGDRLELDRGALFGDVARVLAATQHKPGDAKALAEVAKKHGIDAGRLKNWMELLAAEPPPLEHAQPQEGTPLKLLTNKIPVNPQSPAIQAFGSQAADHLPVVVSNRSDKVANDGGGPIQPHGVACHPSPGEEVAIAWRSPIDARVRVDARLVRVNTPGNGVTWRLEQRREARATRIDDGAIDAGATLKTTQRDLPVRRGDLIILFVGARNGDHGYDLTGVDLTVTDTASGKAWDLARDVAGDLQAANPHADSQGNKDTWHFLQGPDPTVGKKTVSERRIAPGSLLSRWRAAAADAGRKSELAQLGQQVQDLLTGDRPDLERPADRALFDTLTSLRSPLLRGVDLSQYLRRRPGGQDSKPPEGLGEARFTDDGSLVMTASGVVSLRVPAGVAQDRDFAVEAKLDGAGPGGVVQFEVRSTPPNLAAPLEPGTPCITRRAPEDAKTRAAGLEEFRRIFPKFLYHGLFPEPDDEIISLRIFCREDEALQRLFLDDGQKQQLERLWEELRFISQWPLTEFKNYPTFMGYVSQDGKESYERVLKKTKDPVRQRAEAFEKDMEASIPRHLAALEDFAARAYRRPLHAQEKKELTALYQALRGKKLPHDDAFRMTLARVLIAPSFLYRLEQPAAGKQAQPVSNWEQATRLSYFLWATLPDDPLRAAAAAGRTSDVKDLEAQTSRMLRDPRTRGLAIEFAAQWLHVRDLRSNKEKNEKLFPTFDDKLRGALFEETALFFQDLFQSDRSVLDILDADHTFLDETLAKHYGIPGVTGPAWRRVDGVKKYGRGGVLGLGSVLSTQSGASRTSPVLRGNWIVEVLLGEKIPRPPADVPRLPEEETGGDNLTVRQMVEKHARLEQCAVCHVRIDPFGFALEAYDPIGRRRERDLGGRVIDTHAKLKDGTTFEDLAGLRHYLLTQRRDDFVRQFCRKLLGYALGRTVTLSDASLLDEMMADLRGNGYRVSAAVQAIVRSPQFRHHRGLEATKEN